MPVPWILRDRIHGFWYIYLHLEFYTVGHPGSYGVYESQLIGLVVFFIIRKSGRTPHPCQPPTGMKASFFMPIRDDGWWIFIPKNKAGEFLGGFPWQPGGGNSPLADFPEKKIMPLASEPSTGAISGTGFQKTWNIGEFSRIISSKGIWILVEILDVGPGWSVTGDFFESFWGTSNNHPT